MIFRIMALTLLAMLSTLAAGIVAVFLAIATAIHHKPKYRHTTRQQRADFERSVAYRAQYVQPRGPIVIPE